MKLFLGLVVMSLSSVGFASSAEEAVKTALVYRAISDSHAEDLIDWKVGDSADYDMQIPSFPIPMTMSKKVTEDTGEAIWMVEEVTGIMNQKIETLIRKSDGKILQMKQNGQDTTPPSGDDIQIISQTPEEVTVPAGTFKALKVVAKTGDADLQVWINTATLPMDGAAKMIVVQQGTEVDILLTKFLKQ